MYNSEQLQEKWQPVLNHPDLPEITDSYKRAVTAVILENQERELKEQKTMLAEADTSVASVANWDPVLISLVRRAMPNLMAYDICGVQPMSGPTGLIFPMKARMGDGATGTAESLYPERIEDHMSDDEIEEYTLRKRLDELMKKKAQTMTDPSDEFMRKSTDKIFDIINSPAGKAFLPGSQMINIIDRLIDNAITDDELEEATTTGY